MSDRNVVMIAVDPTHAEFVRGLIRDALKAAYDFGVVDRKAWGPIHLLEDEDAELAYDLMQTPESGGGRHTLVVSREDFTVHVEHSLVCRRADLRACPILRLAIAGMDQGLFDDDLDENGRLRVRLDRGVLLWGDDL